MAYLLNLSLIQLPGAAVVLLPWFSNIHEGMDSERFSLSLWGLAAFCWRTCFF